MIESPAVETNARGQIGKSGVLFATASPDGISRSALHKAACLAQALGTGLELFYRAFDPNILHPSHEGTRSVEEGIHEYLEQRRKQLRSLVEELQTPGLSVHSRVEWDNCPDEGIVREVLRRRPALLVVESFRKGPAERLLFEKTVHRLIETCPCPLLLIRTACAYAPHTRIVAAVDPMHAHAEPAALDDAILTVASEVSEALEAELHLFHARMPWAVVSHQSRALRWVPDVAKEDDQVAYEHVVLSRVTDLARRHNIPGLRLHVVDGEVTHCLPSFLRADPADIVAIGALSRSFLQRVLIGNTTRRLVDELDCDVLVVKPPGFRTPVGVPEP